MGELFVLAMVGTFLARVTHYLVVKEQEARARASQQQQME